MMPLGLRPTCKCEPLPVSLAATPKYFGSLMLDPGRVQFDMGQRDAVMTAWACLSESEVAGARCADMTCAELWQLQHLPAGMRMHHTQYVKVPRSTIDCAGCCSTGGCWLELCAKTHRSGSRRGGGTGGYPGQECSFGSLWGWLNGGLEHLSVQNVSTLDAAWKASQRVVTCVQYCAACSCCWHLSW